MNVSTVDRRYRIRSPLRCDGVGSLDCAEDLESGARMAIRWLPLAANGDAAAKVIEKLPAHPMLPKIRGTGQVGEAAYVAMDFPEGRLLSAILEEPMSAALVRRLGAELADALATVHEQGAFHGELSADSILVLPDGKSILWDMPLVLANRLTDRRGEERFMRQLLHMAAFLSPERACGRAASLAGDVYSLAAVLCFAGGARMLSELPTLEVVHRIATGAWKPEVPAGLHEDMRRLVIRMLSPEPSERPDPKEVAAKLSALPPLRPSEVLTQPVPAPVEAPPERIPTPVTVPVAVVPLEVLPAVASASKGLTQDRIPTPLMVPAVVPLAPPVVAEDIGVVKPAITERELPAIVPPKSAVVAPNIEVSTAQINPDEVDFDPEVFRRRTPWLLVGAFALLFVLAGIVVAWNFPWSSASAPAGSPAPQPVIAAAPTAEPAASDDPPADPEAAKLLVPLVSKHPHSAPAAKPRKATPAKSAKASAPSSASKEDPDKDFSFLSNDADAPKSELKRPSF